jgi:hypothetical protein
MNPNYQIKVFIKSNRNKKYQILINKHNYKNVSFKHK